MGKTNELSITKSSIDAMETVLSECSLSRLATMSTLQRTLTLAQGMQELRELIDGPVLDRFKSLTDSPLGFLTDHAGKAPYSDIIIRDCVIEAMLRGAQPIGNEFNIIAGRCYLTKQFYERAVRDWEGLSELRLVEGVPYLQTNGALVAMTANWKLHGRTDSIECVKTENADARIAVRVNAGMGTDAILGKAKRKLLARVYARISGSTWAESDAEAEVLEGQVASEVVTEADVLPDPVAEIQDRFELESPEST
jgi:hypothetical protein